MRPSILNPLFAAITTLPGIGDKVARLYRRLLGREDTPRVVDLVFHLPTGAVDRRARPKLRDVVPGAIVTVAVTIDRHRPPPPNRPRAPYQIYASDDTGSLVITYFEARKDYIDRLLPVGQRRFVSGTMALYDGMLQMVHPDFVVEEAALASMPADRADLSAHRGADAAGAPPRHRGGARARAGAGGVARPGSDGARAMAGFRRRPADVAPARGAGRSPPGGPGVVAARL